ncbi:T9SS type A sorting domain-containing protein [Brumimicrobium glaciale]|uniref:T9SS type A sorting domain-containing protein n=1 Tax=Brumimicrobium glaciale TaxID=200475 RepID=A0A4Q4KNV5_9FLAO|nr:T9SS type A sorting domain-containing protein [Brumimicrobium glaciale]RYM35141.1 T9SS type A sorting domain-containing protein [Brumimicrobium glaciale]
MKKILLTSILIIFHLHINAQDGNLDTSFDPDIILNSVVNTSAIQDDGKIILGGHFESISSSGKNRIVRLNLDGTVDNSFNIGGGFDNIVRAISIQEDGKILVGGEFSSYNGSNVYRIARLNINGTLDTSFNAGILDGTIHCILILENGKIVVGGNFLELNANIVNHIARLNADGSIDQTFNSGSGFDTNTNNVMSFSIQTDGKIIVGGNFSSYNGSNVNRIARLNADGSLDPNFISGAGFNSVVRTTSIQNDGKILVGGAFSYYNNFRNEKIIRLNIDGSIDTSFNLGEGFDNDVWTISIQNDYKIIVGGDFSEFSNTGIKNIARLNSDGVLDNSFNSVFILGGSIRTTQIQNDGKIIIGGEFHLNNGVERNRIARLNSTTLGTSNINLEAQVKLYPNPTTEKIMFNVPQELIGKTLTITNTSGQIMKQKTITQSDFSIDFGSYINGVYFLNTNSGRIIKKIIKQ